jgi:hypothetical protein
MRFHRLVAGLLLAGTSIPFPAPALDKPTGAPLVMSAIETEQPIPLAYLSPDGKTAACSSIRLHWTPAPSTSVDDSATLLLDIPPESAAAATFTAQFWNASLAGSLAWQSPWQGAHWNIFETPSTDGTGIDAALAVGMIATSARRPYPKDTLIIGNLHPDSSLGAVSRLADRLDAAAKAGIARVIIPKTEEFETDADGHVIDILHHAEDLGLKCVPVGTIVEATEVAMNDPLPDAPTDAGPPKYSADTATYIDGFAQREKTEATSGMVYAPREDQLSQYPARQAATWRQVYAEVKEGNEAYKDGKFYVAFRLLARANSRMRGLNALTEDQVATTFDVKSALDTSEQLQAQLHVLMTPPVIDRAELQSAMLVAEMADWAYDIQALLEGSELVTKQTFSQRSDATATERERAREAIVSANEEARYLLDGAEFYHGLLPHLGDANPMPANTSAATLLPQLIPAQLATAQIFADGIRPQASDLRVGLLFDPRLVAYVNVLRDEKAQWDARVRRRNDEVPTPAPAASTNAAAASTTDANSTNAAPVAATPTVSTNSAPVGFDPGNSYAPPHTEVDPTDLSQSQKKLSDVAQCLIWVNTDCEIASLDQKYLRLKGAIDPTTREWHVQNRAQLDALLDLATTGAQQGAAFANQAQVSPDVFAMILERASYLRQHGDDTNALAGLRNYWRCALLGNMCWQLAHTHKAAAVDLSAENPPDKKGKEKTADAAKTGEAAKAAATAKAASTNAATANAPATNAPSASATNVVATPATNAPAAHPPGVPTPAVQFPNAAAGLDQNGARMSTEATNAPSAAPAPATVAVDPGPAAVVPVAQPEAKGNNAPPVALPVETNAAPVAAGPVPAIEESYPRALPVELPAPASPAPNAPAPSTNAALAPAPAPGAKPDDEYTGGEGAAPVALPVNPPVTNAPAAVPVAPPSIP